MPRWYYSTNGKAEGPVTPEFLIENLKGGTFTLVDLVFQEGESAWKTFGEVPEFREAFQAPPPAFVAAIASAPVIATPHASVPSMASDASLAIADSSSVSEFRKPDDGWPSDWRLSSSWIVLRKREDGSGYDQDGPYSAEHIIEMIGQGRIDYSQYCWKPGYTRWFRIGNLPEFDRRKRDRENDQVNQIVPVPAINESLPALSREELLANVEQLRRDRRAERAGVEDNGPDLLEQPVFATGAPSSATSSSAAGAAAVVNQPVKQPAKQPELIPAAVTDAALPSWDELLVNQRAADGKSKKFGSAGLSSRKTLRFALAFAVAAAVVIGMMQMSGKKRDPASTPVEQPKKKTPKSKSAENDSLVPPASAEAASALNAPSNHEAGQPARANVDANAAKTAQPLTAPLAPKPASVLEIVALKLESASPSLTFQTDAGPSDVIRVQLKGRTGEVLTYASFAKTLEVTRTGGELPTLDLAKLELPHGTYTVLASVGTVQTSKTIFVGEKNAAFTSALEQHIKAISYRQQAERSALFYGSLKLEKLAKALLTQSAALKKQPLKWKKALADWRLAAREAAQPVMTLAQVGENDAVFPEQLTAFKTAALKLSEQAKAVDEAASQKREIATEDTVGQAMSEVATDFTQIRSESARLSGRPQASN